MIVAKDLSKSFGKVVAVDSISFRIPEGRVVGFLGPNGAGKTTTIRMIAGSLPPSAGTVTVGGFDVRTAPLPVRRRIGYLPESTPLYGEMRVLEYLRFRARLFGVRASDRRRAIETALGRCRLTEVRRRPIRHLSKGYKQRVGLAAALLHEPPVLILDEPTVGLDPTQIRDVRALIRELAGAHTILLSTHILPEVELACDDIMMMAGGRIRVQGSVEALRESAARGSRYIVETDGAAAADAVRGVAGVKAVDESALDATWRRLSITPKSGAPDLREAIGAAVRRNNAAVRELKREAPSLEQMFMEVVSGSDPRGATGTVSSGPAAEEDDDASSRPPRRRRRAPSRTGEGTQSMEEITS